MAVNELVIETSESVSRKQTFATPKHRKDVEGNIWILDRAMTRGSVPSAKYALGELCDNPYAETFYKSKIEEGYRWLESAISYESLHGSCSLLDMNHPLNREILCHMINNPYR